MCGICGVISQYPLTAELREQVDQMNRSLHHRGPDGEGSFQDRHTALAMRRLSIIDLNSGWQPLYNENRSLVLIANGEIYNFVELRFQLEQRGHRFQTRSDCETILHLYEEYGVDCVLHLRGMFAFALWDSQCQQLLLVRDRMGEKPLYLYEQQDVIFFTSELKSLLQTGLVPFRLDPVAVDLYFHYQFVPEPLTPIKGVRKLDAGHLLQISVDPWRISERCYWSLEAAPPLQGDPVTLIAAELATISRLIVRSDVPVGVALSGGVDSSAIAALAQRSYPGTIHAFSVGYPGYPLCDERAEAQALARQLGVPLHTVELTTDAMVGFFPDLIKWRDDPIADISGYGYYAVSQLARQHNVPVLLMGHGGDELFWGYPSVRQAAIESNQKAALYRYGWRALPFYLQPTLPTRRTPRALAGWAKSGFGLRTGLERFHRHRKSPANQLVFYDLETDFQQARRDMQLIYVPDFTTSLNGSRAVDLFTVEQPWTQIDSLITVLISNLYLRENGITQGDRLSMACSVELRLPFVDYRLAEIVIGLRKAQPDHQLPPKAWLKAALCEVLPASVLNRPKRGFAPPINEWYRALFAAYGSQLNGGYLVQSSVLEPAAACDLARGPHPQGVVTPLSFKALVLEIWCREMQLVGR